MFFFYSVEYARNIGLLDGASNALWELMIAQPTSPVNSLPGYVVGGILQLSDHGGYGMALPSPM